MIQIITGDYERKKEYQEDSKYCISDFKEPKSFDDFEINILDLSFSELWENNDNSTGSINFIKDITHYKNIINNSNEAKIVVVLPQNNYFRYNYYSREYHYGDYLKNLTKLIEQIVLNNIYAYAFQLEFETTKTTLNKLESSADFHFPDIAFEKENIILTSDKSNKITTVNIKERLYYTTLNIFESKVILEEFLYKTNILNDDIDAKPEWIDKINIFDDVEIKNNIHQIEEEITKKEKQKEEEIEKLLENEKIKSILYQTDKKLQNEVIEILNEILEYRDDNFIDEMEEDFRIKKDDVTFIIETKGLSRNIKGTDVNKTFNHVLMYEEKIEQCNSQENVKGIFIVATQREKKIEEREETPDRQIKIAERNNILIIRTETLLKLYEQFKRKEMNTEDIIKIFKEQKGELKIS